MGSSFGHALWPHGLLPSVGIQAKHKHMFFYYKKSSDQVFFLIICNINGKVDLITKQVHIQFETITETKT